MGMLDDAIREHLELKRLRGADASDVAREENEALGPVGREAEPQQGGGPSTNEVSGETAASDSIPETPRAPEPGSALRGLGGVSQETMEIDMEQALAEENPTGSRPDSQAGTRDAPVGDPAQTQSSSGDSLEWEMPGDHATDEAAIDGETAEDPIEDVLEETPDFLRETPEHERLWFEQRPPRDFDFDE